MHKKVTRKKKKESIPGQADIFGIVHGLDKLVKPPIVLEENGLSIVHFAISEEDKSVPGYLDEVKEQARKLQPEAQSIGKPPWMSASWQAKQRKKRAGVYDEGI